MREQRHVLLPALPVLKVATSGTASPLVGGVSEMRIDYGPGYRVYFRQKGNVLVILLCGGDKSTQRSDIRRAQELAEREG